MSESLQDLLPFTVSAPSPDARTRLIPLQIDRDLAQQYAGIGAKNRIFQLFYNVCGILPPVNNIGYHEAQGNQGAVILPNVPKGVESSTALFQGLRRPCLGQGRADDVFIYIVKPTYVYEYIPHMVCVAKSVAAPEKSVFAVYVFFDNKQPTTGTIVQFEFVKADTKQPDLPNNFINRYDKQIW